MTNKELIFKITRDNVKLYESKRKKLPCMDCLVKPTCFNERKATKKAKHLRYTIELKKACIDAILRMHLIQHSKDTDLFLTVKKMETFDTKELFKQSRSFFINGYTKTACLMSILVVERDPNYVHDDDETPYLYLGTVFEDNFKDYDRAIELYSREIKLTKGDALVFERRGFCYLKNNELKKGLEDLKKLNPDEVNHIDDLGKIIQDVENRLKGQKGNVEFDSLYK